VSRGRLAVDDHGGVAGDDHSGAMSWPGTRHLVAHARNALAMGIAHLRHLDHNAAMIRLVTQHDEWSTRHPLPHLLCLVICQWAPFSAK
jgi:hypothetical protein